MSEKEYSILNVVWISLFLFDLATSYVAKQETIEYEGVIKENSNSGTDVQLDKPLYVRSRLALGNEEICGYTIYKSLEDFPFRVELVEPLTGSARIVLAASNQLDYEKVREYKFEIAAHDCSRGVHSPREKVTVRVEDVNDHTPRWVKGYYSVDLEEHRIYGKILQVEAVDEDGSEPFYKICHYRVINTEAPFIVDDDGHLKNTAPLDYVRQSSYTLEVLAEDCAGGVSTSAAVVHINVTPMCRPHWTGVQDVMEFSSLSHGHKLIYPTATLDLCGLMTTCNISLISASVKLMTSYNDDFMCDVDRDSLESRRKQCGLVAEVIDLLPISHANNTTEGHDGIYRFDGKTTAVSVPMIKLGQGGQGLGRKFTISTWLKHGEEDYGFDYQGDKEHVICLADGEGMNRHHMTLTIHNCRLILLLRHDSSFNDDVDMSRFVASEWRWKIQETCDSMWHHYVISVDYPTVRLYIDGQLFAGTNHNPEIIDDWPLHHTTLVKTTRLSIGACWQGRNQRYAQFFKGELAELSVQLNETGDERVIHCLNRCNERLDFTSLNEMSTASSISMSNDQTSIVINSARKEEVETLIHRMIYVNTRLTPSLGRRQLSLETRAICTDETKLTFEMKTSVVQVVRAQPPTFIISASPHIVVEDSKLKEGVHLFPHLTIGIKINSSNIDEEKEEIDSVLNEYELSACLVQSDSHMNLTTEHLTYTHNFIHDLGLRVDISRDGLVISGADKISIYEDVLRGISYSHDDVRDVHDRTFMISCTEDSGRYVTNKLSVTLGVIRHEPTVKPIPAEAAVHHMEVPQQKVLTVEKMSLKDASNPTSKEIGVRMAVGILACVGLMILLAVLGAVRMRGIREQNKEVGIEDKQEMEWDNSALTITVNPMENELMYGEGLSLGAGSHEEGESEDEASCSRDVEVDQSEDETSTRDVDVDQSDVEPEAEGAGPVKPRELEWDDSTLTYAY